MDMREEAVNRMLRLLDRFSKKLKVAICLPLLLDHPKFKNTFRHHYAKEYEQLVALFGDANFDESSRVYEAAAAEEEDDGCFSKSVIPYDEQQRFLRSKYRLANTLEILSKYEDEMLTMLMDSSSNSSDMFANHRAAIDRIESLKLIVEREMRSTPAGVHDRKIELRNAEAVLIEAEEDKANLGIAFAEETLGHEKAIGGYRKEIRELSEIVDEAEKMHREDLKSKTNNFETKLSESIRDAEEDESNVRDQLEAHRSLVRELLRANLDREKSLREKCRRSEIKRREALDAYDRELSKLNDLKDRLEEELSLTERHWTILKDEYEVQTVLHQRLKKERELAIIKAFAERMDYFEKNRAARVIQRTWRAHRERVQAARRKKKKARRNKI